MNTYANLGMLSRTLRTGARDPGSADADVRLRMLETASREIEQRTGRSFAARVGQSRYYSGPRGGGAALGVEDFASITSVSTHRQSDGTYDYSLIADTDYWAIRPEDDANRPIWRLELIADGQITTWPRGPRDIRIVGTRGYSYETEAITADDATAVTGTLASAADISLALSVTNHGVTPGDTLLLESEQVYVEGTIDAQVVRVTRGANGTTAAAHAAVSVSRRRYPRDIEAACVMRAADLVRGAQSAWAENAGADDVSGFTTRTSYAQFIGLLAPYRLGGIGFAGRVAV